MAPKKTLLLDDHLSCFGHFNIDNVICKTHCALSVKCAIERDQSTRLDMLDDLASLDEIYLKIQ